MDKEVQGIRHPVEHFCAQVRQHNELGVQNATLLRAAFRDLLKTCVRRLNWRFVPDWTCPGCGGSMLRFSGAVLDTFHLTRGVWEFDAGSSLESRAALPGGAPVSENFLLQNSVRARVRQRNDSRFESPLDSTRGMAAVVEAFFSYRSFAVAQWERAAAGLDQHLPELAGRLLQSLRRERLTHRRFSRTVNKIITLAQSNADTTAPMLEWEKCVARELLLGWLRLAAGDDGPGEGDTPRAALRGLLAALHAARCHTIGLLDELTPFRLASEKVIRNITDPAQKKRFLDSVAGKFFYRFPLDTCLPGIAASPQAAEFRIQTQVRNSRGQTPWMAMDAIFGFHTSGIRADPAALSFRAAPLPQIRSKPSDPEENSSMRGEDFSRTPRRRFLYRPFVSMFLHPAAMAAGNGFGGIFPDDGAESENRLIAVSLAARKPFSCLMIDRPADWHVAGGFGTGSHCFPLYVYERDGGRVENVADSALERFCAFYGDRGMSREGVFNYVYGILHHPEYRDRFGGRLRWELPRIPFEPAFEFYADAGRRLGRLHANFEGQPEHPLHVIDTDRAGISWRVRKMGFSPDRTAIFYNNAITIAGIPAPVLAYRLGNRSALGWVVDRFRHQSGPNATSPGQWERSDEPESVIGLIARVAMVSLETLKVIASFPPLTEMTEAAPRVSVSR